VERIAAASEVARALPNDMVLTARAENYLWDRPDLDDTIRTAAQAAGAAETEIVFDYTESAPMIEGRALFIEATLTARATGRPALASPD
jgi:hypothetical protein